MKDNLTVTGTIKVIGSTEQVSEKFKKRLLVVTTDDKYPQDIPIDFTQDNVDILDKVEIGQVVTVNINLRGNEWKGKYYLNAQGWKLEAGTAAPKKGDISKEESDLPF